LRSGHLSPLLASTLLTFACASIDPGPFEDFRHATHQVRAGTDTILLLDYEWSRRGFVETILRGAPEELSTLFLTFDENDPFEVRLELLARLAGSEVIRPKTFDTLERDLNASLREATKSLEKESRAGTEAAVGLFSTAASKAFRTYIEKRRAKDLRAAMEHTQPAVEDWATVAVDAVDNVRDDLKSEYDARKAHISQHYAEAHRGKKSRDQRRLIEEMVDLDATVVDTFALLRTLRRAFLSLPGAHRQLAESTRNAQVSLDAVRKLSEQGQHLRVLEQRLSRGSGR
jgi:Tfp pilus assembly protein PilE